MAHSPMVTREPCQEPFELCSKAVLVVSSNADSRDRTCRVLDAAGFETTACSAASEALAALGRKRHPVLVIDFMLDDMSGFALFQACLEADRSIRGVMTAEHGEVGAAVRAVREGLVDFLPGPADARVVQAVRGALRTTPQF